MNTETLKNHIETKLRELDQKKDEQEYVSLGRIGFGLATKDYQHLPSWSNFVAGKKRLQRLIWIQAFFLSLFIYSFSIDLWDHNWLIVLLKTLTMALVNTLVFTVWVLYSLIFDVNKVQREVKKLLYEDLLQKLQQEEPVS